MEKFSGRESLVKHIGHIRLIIPYLGSIAECAATFRSICRSSQQEWDMNQHIIIDEWMQDKDCKTIIDIGQVTGSGDLDNLLEN